MNTEIIAQQMLILFLMMASGYYLSKRGLISKEGVGGLSSVIINLLNPCLIIASVINKEIRFNTRMVCENILLVIGFFTLMIVLSKIFIKLLRVEDDQINTYRLMTIFPNLGFMGIPLVRSVYGEEAVIFVAFYCIGYNILMYSYGIMLAAGGGGKKVRIQWKRMCNVGFMAGIATVMIFAFHIQAPPLVEAFITPMGNAVVPLSMMTVGIMVAQSDIKEVFTDKRNLLFTLIDMILVPAVCIPILRLLPIDPLSYGVFILMASMPVGSIVIMVEKEYGTTDGSTAARGIALSSVVSALTIPLISYLA